jgi:hypothetical protein
MRFDTGGELPQIADVCSYGLHFVENVENLAFDLVGIELISVWVGQ